MAVPPAAAKRYAVCFEDFEKWSAGPVLPDSTLDLRLVDYLDDQFVRGAPRSTAECAVCAVRARSPLHSGRNGVGLPRAERALKGYRRVVPARTRYPMPWALAAATAMLLVARASREAAIAPPLIHFCDLRPGELKKCAPPPSAQLTT